MKQATHFLQILSDNYHNHKRKMPWRQLDNSGTVSPYHALVSEFMLQQTQVARVIPKFQEFLMAFPDLQALANASQAEVVAHWSGLGYNRRAVYVHQAAQQLVLTPEPWRQEDLIACKGIGSNTAAAIRAYSYNEPVLFLETNIKTVLIHHFYQDRSNISDKELLVTLESVVPWNNAVSTPPRDFYWSLMDYGTHLKATLGNQSHRSQTFTRQSRFEGSRRQIRGQVIKLLLHGQRPLTEVREKIKDPRLEDVIEVLIEEKLVVLRGNMLMLYNEVSKI